MLSGYRTEEQLIRNMVDAGCEEETVASVLTCLKQGQKKKGLLLLQGQREKCCLTGFTGASHVLSFWMMSCVGCRRNAHDSRIFL